MWDKIAGFILKYRAYCLAIIGIFAVAMGYFATKSELAYDLQKLIPSDDPDMVVYEDFKRQFGEDGNKVIIGFKSDKIFEKKTYAGLQALSDKIATYPGVTEVVSPARCQNLIMNDSSGMLEAKPFPGVQITTSALADSFGQEFLNLKFYRGRLINETENVAIIIASLDDATLNSPDRIPLINKIKADCKSFGEAQKVDMHFSGLPFVRTELSTTVKSEIVLFTLIAFLVTAIIIFVFFRSLATLAVSLIFIAIGVISMLGLTALFGFKITLITGTLPPVLVVIGVQNTIYFINKYHEEYRATRNQKYALSMIISRLGVATFLINFTTAVGFGTFYFTKTQMLEQYGLLSFVVINVIFFINIIGIPALYSYLKTPSDKQTDHLEAPRINKFLNWVKYYSFNHKRRIFFWSLAATIFGGIYMTKLKPLAYMVDDLPESSVIMKDLKFFQESFGGVMPFEIIVKCHDEGGARSAEVLNKVNSFQRRLRKFPELSPPLSLIEVASFANQAYNDGNPDYYRLPNALDLGNLTSSLPKPKKGKKNIMRGLTDSTFSSLRISYQMQDIGSQRMDSLVKKVQGIADAIFPKDSYEIQITGTSAVFLKGNTYLYESLLSSTLWALLIIGFTMGLLFPSLKMILISVIPNIIPLIITAGLMGFFDIPLKPSTILVFSIAFGITIDATIHFISVFKSHLTIDKQPMRKALSETIMEVGLSMIYTMVALFAGFMIFAFSDFKGTQALGWLTGTTLFTGLVANLFLLPALILAFEKNLNLEEEFKESILDMPRDM
jgi:uncharacterized protein